MKWRYSLRNEISCYCGSGLRFVDCCDVQSVRKLWPKSIHPDTASLRERNLSLVTLLEDVFGLSKLKNIDELKLLMTDDKLRALYAGVAAVFPYSTDFESLLPASSGELRSYFMAPIEPDTILNDIVRYSLYTDQIFMLNPFPNPICMAPRFNPMLNPLEYRLYTLKTLISLKFLLPWIRAGIVQLIPDPSDLNYKFRRKTWEDADARLSRLTQNELEFLLDDEDEYSKFAQQLSRALLGAPKRLLEDEFKSHFPQKSDIEIRELLEAAQRMTENDPLALSGIESQLLLSVGGNLELAMFLATGFDAYPFTVKVRQWRELEFATKEFPESARLWSPLTKGFQSLDFGFLDSVDVAFANKIREDGRLENFRAFLKRTWVSMKAESDWSEEKARSFADELKSQHQQCKGEWDKINQELVKSTLTGIAGFFVGTAVPSLGAMLAVPGSVLMGKSVTDLFSIIMKQRSTNRTAPASMFMQVESNAKLRNFRFGM